MEISCTVIGNVEQHDGCRIVLQAPYKHGLKGLAGFGHVQVVWFADQAGNAGSATPRSCAELVNRRVLTKEGLDLTEPFVEGSRKALALARAQGCSIALLMERSPSCGSTCVYDGTFSGTLIEGEGVFANLLREQGFTLYTPKTIDALMKANTVSYESEHR